MRKTTSIRKRRNQVLTKLGNAVTTFIRRRKYNENNKSSSHDTIRITAIEMKEIRKYLRWRRISGRYPPILWNVSTELPANRWRWSQQPWRTCSYGEAGQNRQKVNNNNNQHHTKWTCSTAQNEATNITTTTRLEREKWTCSTSWKNSRKTCQNGKTWRKLVRPSPRLPSASGRDGGWTKDQDCATATWPPLPFGLFFFFCFVLFCRRFFSFSRRPNERRDTLCLFFYPFLYIPTEKRGRTDGWMDGLWKGWRRAAARDRYKSHHVVKPTTMASMREKRSTKCDDVAMDDQDKHQRTKNHSTVTIFILLPLRFL